MPVPNYLDHPALQYMQPPLPEKEQPADDMVPPAPSGSRSPLLMEAMRRLLMAQAPPEPTVPLDRRMEVINSMGGGKAKWQDVLPSVAQSAFTAMAQPGTGSAVRDFAVGGAMGAGAYTQARQTAQQQALMRQRLGLQAIQDTEEAQQKANDSRVRQGSANVRALSSMQRMIDSEKSLEREANKKPPSTYEFKGTSDGKLYRVDNATGEHMLIAGGTQPLTGKAAEISGLLSVMGVDTKRPWSEWGLDAQKMATAIAGVRTPTVGRMDPKAETYRKMTELIESGKTIDSPEVQSVIGQLRALTVASTAPRAPRATGSGGASAATQRGRAVEELYNTLNPNGLPPEQIVEELERMEWPMYVDDGNGNRRVNSVRRADVIRYAGDLKSNGNRARGASAASTFFFGPGAGETATPPPATPVPATAPAPTAPRRQQATAPPSMDTILGDIDKLMSGGGGGAGGKKK